MYIIYNIVQFLKQQKSFNNKHVIIFIEYYNESSYFLLAKYLDLPSTQALQRDSDDCIMFGRVKCSALCVLRTLGCSSCSQQLNNPTLLIRSCVLAGSASLSVSLPANDGTCVLAVVPEPVWNRKCWFISGWVHGVQQQTSAVNHTRASVLQFAEFTHDEDKSLEAVLHLTGTHSFDFVFAYSCLSVY